MDFCHLKAAHMAWGENLKPGDWAIDATCGNGRDTEVLARLVGPSGGVIALDLQQEAIDRSKERVTAPWVKFYCQSHETFPIAPSPIQLIIYNLGYLPGGDKSITTLVESTLLSLKRALFLLKKGGLLSIMLYPGHPEGAREKKAILTWVSSLSGRAIQHQERGPQAPSLLLIS